MRVSSEFEKRCRSIQDGIREVSGEDISFENITLVLAKGMPKISLNMVIRKRKRKGTVEQIIPVRL